MGSRTAGAPSAPATPAARTLGDGEDGGAVAVRWRAADGNGSRITRYVVEVYRDGRRHSQVVLGAKVRSHRVVAKNGSAYAFRVRARNVKGFGRWSRLSRAVTPYGRPYTPQVSARSNATSVTLSWAAVRENGRTIDQLLVSIDGGAWTAEPNTSGSRTVGDGFNETHSVRVKAVDSTGGESLVGAASATSQAPSPQVGVRLESTAPVHGCQASCRWIQIGVSGMRPGTYPIYVDQEGYSRPPDWNGRFSITVGANGTGSRNNTFYTGFPGRVTVTVNGVRGAS